MEDDEDNAEFNAWAAELYSRNLTFWEAACGLLFPVFIICLLILIPIIWPATVILRDMKRKP